jgi:cholesterol transport system auxiliary component
VAPRLSVLLLALMLVPLAVGGCLSRKAPERRTFVLAAERPDGPETGGAGVLRVERIVVAPLYERKAFIYRTAENSFESDFYNEFFVPPGALVRHATMEWLSQSSAVGAVIGGRAPGEADWVLEGRVHKLYADLREPAAVAIIEVEFTVLDARAPTFPVVFQKRYGASTHATDRSPDALAAAWSEALGRILTEFEADLRRATEGRAALSDGRQLRGASVPSSPSR